MVRRVADGDESALAAASKRNAESDLKAASAAKHKAEKDRHAGAAAGKDSVEEAMNGLAKSLKVGDDILGNERVRKAVEGLATQLQKHPKKSKTVNHADVDHAMLELRKEVAKVETDPKKVAAIVTVLEYGIENPNKEAGAEREEGPPPRTPARRPNAVAQEERANPDERPMGPRPRGGSRA